MRVMDAKIAVMTVSLQNETVRMLRCVLPSGSPFGRTGPRCYRTEHRGARCRPWLQRYLTCAGEDGSSVCLHARLREFVRVQHMGVSGWFSVCHPHPGATSVVSIQDSSHYYTLERIPRNWYDGGGEHTSIFDVGGASMKATDRYERWWATGLIVLGAALLGIVFFMAFSIVSDPGGYYDEWIPAEGPEGPEASFDWVASGSVADFTDTSTTGDSDIVAWAWEFGDGTQSTDPNPSHRFTEDGEYTATLDVVDGNGASSQASGTVATGLEGPGSGTGEIGMSDLADKAIAAIERSAKGAGVVVLVIGMFVVLTMVGGRFVRQGVRALRPIPDKIRVKLRPKELELSAMEPTTMAPATTEALPSPESFVHDPARDEAEQPVESRTG